MLKLKFDGDCVSFNEMLHKYEYSLTEEFGDCIKISEIKN